MAGPKCPLDHVMLAYESIARGEIATRLLVLKDDVGLSDEQFERVNSIARGWRTRYSEIVGEASHLEYAIHDQLVRHDPDLTRVAHDIERRSHLMRIVEEEFVAAWASVWAVITPEQHARLLELYRAELEPLPHPVRQARYVTEPAESADAGHLVV